MVGGNTGCGRRVCVPGARVGAWIVVACAAAAGVRTVVRAAAGCEVLQTACDWGRLVLGGAADRGARRFRPSGTAARRPLSSARTRVERGTGRRSPGGDPLCGGGPSNRWSNACHAVGQRRRGVGGRDRGADESQRSPPRL